MIQHLLTIGGFATIEASSTTCLKLLSTVSGVLGNFYFEILPFLACSRICILIIFVLLIFEFVIIFSHLTVMM